MNPKKHPPLVWWCAALICLALFFSACHSSGELKSSYSTGPSSNDSIDKSRVSDATGSENFRVCKIPETGQEISYAAGDDGDLKKGQKWPKTRLLDNGDGTVTDRLTGFMWTKNADKAAGTADWEAAVSNSAACHDGGHSDWRLPNRKELESLIDLGRFNPALPAGHPFENVRTSYYWSSTSQANNNERAWVVHCYTGFVTSDDKAGTHYVWYVRGEM